jgi:hypothetical protein
VDQDFPLQFRQLQYGPGHHFRHFYFAAQSLGLGGSCMRAGAGVLGPCDPQPLQRLANTRGRAAPGSTPV